MLAAHWTEKLHDDRERLTIAIDEIRPYAKHIFLLNQPPILPRGLNRAALRAGQRPPFFEEKSTQKVRRSINQFLREFESQGVTVIDVSKKFETAAGAILFLDEDGRQLYQDATHLSGYGAAKIDEMLRQALSRAESIH